MNPAGENPWGKAACAIMLVALILLVDHIGFFYGINNHFYDLFFRLRGARAPAGNIAIIAIDDKTLEKLGRWPIDLMMTRPFSNGWEKRIRLPSIS